MIGWVATHQPKLPSDAFEWPLQDMQELIMRTMSEQWVHAFRDHFEKVRRFLWSTHAAGGQLSSRSHPIIVDDRALEPPLYQSTLSEPSHRIRPNCDFHPVTHGTRR